MIDLFKLRLAKLWSLLTRPSDWGTLLAGVAPTVEHRAVLRVLVVDGIIDVGANRGQFTLACLQALPGVPVVAFEPIPGEAATYRKVHGRHPDVRLIETALGESNGTATLHLSKSADSSSLLPIGKRQTELFANTREVAMITVPVNRLDDYADYWQGRSGQLLKIDVQGFELNVLRGAIQVLKTCAFVYAECSEIELYDGQALRAGVEAFLNEQGFVRQSSHNEQRRAGQLIQADYLFRRI